MSRHNDHFRSLLAQVPDGAMEYLYRNYFSRMVRIAESKTHDRQIAQDIVQDAFFEVWDNRETFGHDPEFMIDAYIMTVVVRRSINSFRKSSYLTQAQLDFIAMQIFHYNPVIENDIFAKELHDKLMDILSTFPELERDLLTLRFFHSMGNEAIAYRLDIHIKTVEKHMQRAYKRLESFRSAF